MSSPKRQKTKQPLWTSLAMEATGEENAGWPGSQPFGNAAQDTTVLHYEDVWRTEEQQRASREQSWKIWKLRQLQRLEAFSTTQKRAAVGTRAGQDLVVEQTSTSLFSPKMSAAKPLT